MALTKIISVGTIILLLNACSTAAVNPEDRDRSGTFDGEWLGEVAKPRARIVTLPGNWRMNCEWEPFEIYIVIDDGLVQLGRLESKAAISSKGTFRYDLTSGEAGMQGGVMSGNSKFVEQFSGDLSGESPDGKYRQYIDSLGGEGCTAKIVYQRLDSTES